MPFVATLWTAPALELVRSDSLVPVIATAEKLNMTELYDKPRKFEGKLKPYPHEEVGVERGRAKDPVKYLHAVEQRARERQVAYETVRLLRQEVILCHRKEGVNAYENCKDVSQAYYDQIMKKDLGQLQPEWSKPEMKEGWGDCNKTWSVPD